MAKSTPTEAHRVPRLGIQLENIRKHYGDHVVLDDVSLDVEPGTVTALIGPSGAGKSTFLRCINLLEQPDGGTIRVAGHTIEPGKNIAPKDLARLRSAVGMVFQSFNLFPHMTALKNISFPQQRVLGRGKEEADERAMQLLERVGLKDKANQHPGRCSGGQQQRIAIARALALDPSIMLFDEPTSALDPEVGLEVLAVMRELAADGMTMVVVTHEMQFARDVSDTLVVMADCKIIEQGDPRAIMSDPQEARTRRFLRAVLER
ncbi:amino acid ABC transporter ATP-binding protein [Arthrobacter woluwensis]|uniref:ABC-type polar-amino-acid transporter n=1 Tax=Arthrobacter woluwensis TaxID=156980 RepID=A0A1H4JMT2_9MICC|nr:amino acid ABC transporter ATP-binding protein [Arthrobacter woluwensis]SEB47631.1 amino acid ABC transporter ATP-binding protein, PAAT family [Arthrobacter woluwensis]